MRIAQVLSEQPEVARVHYAGLPKPPPHELARAQMREFGTVVTFDLKDGAQAAGRFADALQLFALAASLGSTESLVVAPQMMGSRDFSAEQLRLSALADGTVRVSIGLEDSDDLPEDVSQALAAIGQ